MAASSSSWAMGRSSSSARWSTPSLRGGRAAGGRRTAGWRRCRLADRVPHRRQSRRRGDRRRRSARRRHQRRRPAAADLRAWRRPDLGRRLRPAQGQARPGNRAAGPPAAQEHQRAGPGLSGADGARRRTARRPACESGAQTWRWVAAASLALLVLRSASRPGCGHGSRPSRRRRSSAWPFPCPTSLDRGAAVQEHERGGRAGVLRRRADRRPDHRSVQDLGAVRHRQELGVRAQGARREGARGGGTPGRALRGRGQRAPCRQRGARQRAARRCDDGRSTLGRALRRQPRRHLRRPGPSSSA